MAWIIRLPIATSQQPATNGSIRAVSSPNETCSRCHPSDVVTNLVVAHFGLRATGRLTRQDALSVTWDKSDARSILPISWSTFGGFSSVGRMNTQFMKVTFTSRTLGSKRTTEFMNVKPAIPFLKITRPPRIGASDPGGLLDTFSITASVWLRSMPPAWEVAWEVALETKEIIWKVAGQYPGVLFGSAASLPQWSLQKRPCVVTSKPAI